MARLDGAEPVGDQHGRSSNRAVRIAVVVEASLLAATVVVAASLPADDGHGRLIHALVGLFAGGLVIVGVGALLLTLVVPIMSRLRGKKR